MNAETLIEVARSFPEAIFLLKGKEIMAANPAAGRMLGMHTADLIGIPLTNLVADPPDKVTAYLKSCARNGGLFIGTLDWRNSGESALVNQVEGCAVRAGGGPYILLRCRRKSATASRFYALNLERNALKSIYRQLEEQKGMLEHRVDERTAELQRINQELDQFAYVASHDLKAPLRAIANLSKWIEEDLGDLEGPVRKQMDLLRGRVQRMENLIDGILQYSRVGRLSSEMSTVDVEHLLAEILDSLAPPQTFTVTIAPDMPVLYAPRIELQQVFANLISNAIKYHDRADGKVTVSAADIGDFYEFQVTDDGPGIAPEYHEKIFVIFQTLEARDKVESTGIGLTIVKKIVEGRGGRISVESEPGRGATFRFTWPKNSLHQEAAA